MPSVLGLTDRVQSHSCEAADAGTAAVMGGAAGRGTGEEGVEVAEAEGVAVGSSSRLVASALGASGALVSACDPTSNSVGASRTSLHGSGDEPPGGLRKPRPSP
jgi:hypothetical protein